MSGPSCHLNVISFESNRRYFGVLESRFISTATDFIPLSRLVLHMEHDNSRSGGNEHYMATFVMYMYLVCK